MSLKDLSKNEINGMTLADLSNQLLKEDGECNTADLYKKITNLKGMTKAEYEDTIADYFAILNTDKRFALLTNGIWGLRENHPIKNDLEELINDEETESLIDEEHTDDEEHDEEIQLFISDDEFEDDEDDMADLVIIDEDEIEEE